MKSIEKRVRAVIEGRDAGRWPFTRALLGVLARAYGGLMHLRAALYAQELLKRRRLPCKVIVIGNLTVGGTGKTPMTIYVASLIRRLGYTVVVISRGYKGRRKSDAAVVGDGRQTMLTAAEAGDEPFMMASCLTGIPVLVGHDRFRSGMLAVERFHPDVIVCDDGFQHLRLDRDLDLVLLDGSDPLGNGCMLPRGVLREPVAALQRADALILTRCSHAGVPFDADLRQTLQTKPVFATRHIPYIHRIVHGQRGTLKAGTQEARDPGMEVVAGRTVYAFSGIARNREFRSVLESSGAVLAGHAEYPDHHVYKPRDIEAVCRSADQGRAQYLATTEKDFARIRDVGTWPLDLLVIGVRIDFFEEAVGFETFLRQRL